MPLNGSFGMLNNFNNTKEINKMVSIQLIILILTVFPSYGELNYLHFLHTVISPISGEVCEFHTSVEFNDIQLSVCKTENKADFLTRFCEDSDRLFRNESEELKCKEQWLQTNLNTMMRLKNTNDTDVHVLQWRHECAVENHSNGSVTFLYDADEYAYDGQTFNLSMHWKPVVLDNGTICNRESVLSLERQCVEILTSFIEQKFITESRPDVYSSVKTSGSSGENQEILVCLATSFYPKHVQMEIRHNQTPLPEDQLSSPGIRLNADGSFQLMKSLEILPSDRSQYQCVVKHQTLTEPLIISWDVVNAPLLGLIGLIFALVILAIIVVLVYCLLRKWCLHSTVGAAPVWESYEVCAMMGTLKPQLHQHLEELGPETCVGLAAVFNADSDEENTADVSIEDPQTPDLPETQSLCDTKVTPAKGAMGSKNISLPNLATEREDADQNPVTQNLLLLPLPRRCKSKDISLPNLKL